MIGLIANLLLSLFYCLFIFILLYYIAAGEILILFSSANRQVCINSESSSSIRGTFCFMQVIVLYYKCQPLSLSQLCQIRLYTKAFSLRKLC